MKSIAFIWLLTAGFLVWFRELPPGTPWVLFGIGVVLMRLNDLECLLRSKHPVRKNPEKN